MLLRLHVWLVMIWAGAAIMAFEVAGARLLMPEFGSGIDVWACVMGVTLGALAIGYCIGGAISDRRPSLGTLALVLFAGSISLAALRMVGRDLPRLFASLTPTAAVCAGAFLVLAVPLVLLGMVQPFVVKLLLHENARAGRVVGAVLAAGTLGGVGGAMATGLFLIPHLGVSHTLAGLACGTAFMAAVSAAVASRSKTSLAIVGLGAAAACGFATLLFKGRETPRGTLEKVEGFYSDLEVFEYRGSIVLACNGITQTALPASGLGLGRGALLQERDFLELIPHFRPRAASALLIGSGGGLHARMLAQYNIETHNVEIDPAVLRLAARHFGFGGEASVADGRAHLNRETRRYDVVLLDAFLDGTLPEHLFTLEAFQTMAERMNRDGLLAIHILGMPGHEAARSIAATLQAVFPHVRLAGSARGPEFQHLYYFASRAPLELTGRMDLGSAEFSSEDFHTLRTDGARVLTDDRSGLALMNRDVVAICRRALRIERTEQP